MTSNNNITKHKNLYKHIQCKNNDILSRLPSDTKKIGSNLNKKDSIVLGFHHVVTLGWASILSSDWFKSLFTRLKSFSCQNVDFLPFVPLNKLFAIHQRRKSINSASMKGNYRSLRLMCGGFFYIKSLNQLFNIFHPRRIFSF